MFAAGRVSNTAGDNQDFIVRAYTAKKGELLWQNQYDFGGYDIALAIAAQGGQVFAAGFVGELLADRDFFIRTYRRR